MIKSGAVCTALFSMEGMMAKKTPTPEKWLQSIKERLSDYPEWVVEAGIAGAIGLAIGFVARNFGRALLLFILCAIITIFLLEQANMIAVKAPGLRALFYDPDHTVMTWVNGIAAFARDRIFVTIALILGFLFGWRLGQ